MGREEIEKVGEGERGEGGGTHPYGIKYMKLGPISLIKRVGKMSAKRITFLGRNKTYLSGVCPNPQQPLLKRSARKKNPRTGTKGQFVLKIKICTIRKVDKGNQYDAKTNQTTDNTGKNPPIHAH